MKRRNLTFVSPLESSEAQIASDWQTCPRNTEFRIEPEAPPEDWEHQVRQIFESFTKTLHTETQAELKLIALSARVKCLESSLEEVRSRAAVVVPIQSLAPENLELAKPIQVLLQQFGDDCVASSLDANINASGETQEEALTNLKDMIVGSFEALSGVAYKLGPGPARQLAILSEFIKKNN